jgi:hypothetical protein
MGQAWSSVGRVVRMRCRDGKKKARTVPDWPPIVVRTVAVECVKL